MIFVYQLFYNFFNIDTSAFFIPATITTTRGHNYKLFKSVVNAETLNTFKSLLNKYWTGQFYLFL